MATFENLDPAVRLESILDGQDIEPATRLEYFIDKAVIGEKGSGDGSVVIYGPAGLSEDLHIKPVASGNRSIAIGADVTASGSSSIAIGTSARATASNSIAIGSHIGSSYPDTQASASNSVAIGGSVVASGIASSAIGQLSEATAPHSHTRGLGLKATGRGCFVIGVNNVEDDNPVDSSHGASARKYLFIIGNGIYPNTKSNALTVDWDGNLVCHNIPAPPAEAGTYRLTCSVSSGGAVTYSWS